MLHLLNSLLKVTEVQGWITTLVRGYSHTRSLTGTNRLSEKNKAWKNLNWPKPTSHALSEHVSNPCIKTASQALCQECCSCRFQDFQTWCVGAAVLSFLLPVQTKPATEERWCFSNIFVVTVKSMEQDWQINHLASSYFFNVWPKHAAVSVYVCAPCVWAPLNCNLEQIIWLYGKFCQPAHWRHLSIGVLSEHSEVRKHCKHYPVC